MPEPIGGTSNDTSDRVPSQAMLRRTARDAMSGSGNVQVRLVDGVAIVTGNLESATDERAIVRALERLEGIEQVTMAVQREM